MLGPANETVAGYKFLIVDDDESIRSVIVRILRKFGAEKIHLATSGADALAKMDAHGVPHVIVTDLNMPEMDGVEFLRHLVGREFRGGIALLSGEDTRVLQAAVQLGQAHELNILGALSKPFSPAAILEMLDQFGSKRKERVSLVDVEVRPEELESALRDGKITAHFQPKVSVETGEILGVETLVRWIDEEKGFIPPDAFISVAEDSGLIDTLSDTVFAVAMKQGAAWLSAGFDTKVAVNVSVDNLGRLDLPEFFVNTARDIGMDPRQVVLEVTESRLMADIVKPLEVLTRLRLKGLELSIDDFGTGASSLEQLKRVPFNELKIDRAFVNGACRDDTARSILESSAALAKKLGMSIVAEGVEDQDDLDLVASLGVDLVQGYFICRPLPGLDLMDWLNEWKKG